MKNILLIAAVVIFIVIIALIENKQPHKKLSLKICDEKGFVYEPVFTRKIILERPIDNLMSSPVSNKSLFFHTQIIALAGYTLTHQWIKDEKIISSQKFNITSDRQITWSKLPASDEPIGNWQVNVALNGCLLSQSKIVIGEHFKSVKTTAQSPWLKPIQAGEHTMKDVGLSTFFNKDQSKEVPQWVFKYDEKIGLSISARKQDDPDDDYLSTLIKSGKSIEGIQKFTKSNRSIKYLNRRTINGDTPLLEAIKSNNQEAALTLLKYKVNIYLKDRNGQSALDLSYLSNNISIQDRIISNIQQGHYLNSSIKNNYNYKNINSRNKHGDTPLLSAIKYNDNATVSELLKLHKEKNSYAYTNMGETILEFSKQNNFNSASVLLEKSMQYLSAPWAVTRLTITNEIFGSEPQNCIRTVSTDDSKLTLFVELMDLKGQIITHQWFYKEQLQYSQDFDIQSDFFKTFSQYQPNKNKLGYWEVQAINQRGKVLAESHFRLQTPKKFHNSYNQDIGDCKLVKNSLRKLVEVGAPIKKLNHVLDHTNFESNYINGIFHLAIKKQYIGIIKAFLKRGIDIEARSKHGRSPLLTAINNKRDIAARFLINHNADIYTKTGFDKHHALEIAARENDIKTLKVLLNAGFDVNYAIDGHMTALHRAIKAGCLTEITKLLIKNGADPNTLWRKNSSKDLAKIKNCWLLDEWKENSVIKNTLWDQNQ